MTHQCLRFARLLLALVALAVCNGQAIATDGGGRASSQATKQQMTAAERELVTLRRQLEQVDAEIADLRLQASAKSRSQSDLQLDQLKLQQAMDRRSKLMQMISNVTKKMAESARQMRQNIK